MHYGYQSGLIQMDPYGRAFVTSPQSLTLLRNWGLSNTGWAAMAPKPLPVVGTVGRRPSSPASSAGSSSGSSDPLSPEMRALLESSKLAD